MNAEWKQKWVQALRSEQYQQTRGELRDYDGERHSFCCLGVLCDLYDRSRWHNNTSCYSFLGDLYWSMPPPGVLAEVGLSEAEANALAQMNDDGVSFHAIAAHIEQTL